MARRESEGDWGLQGGASGRVDHQGSERGRVSGGHKGSKRLTEGANPPPPIEEDDVLRCQEEDPPSRAALQPQAQGCRHLPCKSH